MAQLPQDPPSSFLTGSAARVCSSTDMIRHVTRVYTCEWKHRFLHDKYETEVWLASPQQLWKELLQPGKKKAHQWSKQKRHRQSTKEVLRGYNSHISLTILKRTIGRNAAFLKCFSVRFLTFSKYCFPCWEGVRERGGQSCLTCIKNWSVNLPLAQ